MTMAADQSFGCPYCDGQRSLCSCTEDCGARPSDHGHCCPKAPEDVFKDWLRSTGLYPELNDDAGSGT